MLDILEHPNPDGYSGERIIVIQREDYVYLRGLYPSSVSPRIFLIVVRVIPLSTPLGSCHPKASQPDRESSTCRRQTTGTSPTAS
jgi:hypothetical protein